VRLTLPKISSIPGLTRALAKIKALESFLGDAEMRVLGGDGRSRKWPVLLIAAIVVAIVCFLEIGNVSLFQRLEWITYDARVKLASEHPVPNQINATNLSLVDISDETIDVMDDGSLGFQYEVYWPRTVYAMALQELEQEGAKAVGFDILFSGLRPNDPSPPATEHLPDGTHPTNADRFFISVLTANTNVILGAQDEVLPATEFQTEVTKLGDITTETDRDGVLRREIPYEDYRRWHPILRQMARQYDLKLNATVFGPTNITFYRKGNPPIVFPTDKEGYLAGKSFSADAAGISFLPYRTIRVWSMGIQLAARELNLDLDKAQIEPAQHRIVLTGEHGVSRVIPLNDDGTFQINWELGVNSLLMTNGSLEDLLLRHLARTQTNDDDWDKSQWTNELVMIGSTATGNDLSDVGVSPLGRDTHLVTKHLNVANSIIANRFVTSSPLWLKLALIILMGVMAASINLVQTRPLTGTALMIVAAAAYGGAASWLYVEHRFWLPIVLPLICSGLVIHFGAMIYRVRAEQSEKKFVKSVFTKMLAPEVVEELLDAKNNMSLGGKRREITIYFADVRGFTSLTDRTQAAASEYVRQHNLSPEDAEAHYGKQAEETLATVSAYLATIAGMIKKHNGTLDKYIGDCVMAFWGGPVENSQHARDAVRSAIDAQRAVLALNVARDAENKKIEEENIKRLQQGLAPESLKALLSMGTGINSGSAVMGLMGSEEHQLSYTVFGREVNLASRLEGLSGHSRIIISEATYQRLLNDDPALAALCVERLPADVKGFRHAVKNYEVMWRTPDLPEDPEALNKPTGGIGPETVVFVR
jgi:class 3 adenylate cyclase/CHASE2 domain-containing sensor protein